MRLLGQNLQGFFQEDIGPQSPLLVRLQAVVLDQDGRDVGRRTPAVRVALAQPAVVHALLGITIVDCEDQFSGDVALRLQRGVHVGLEGVV
ncbi:hypothetical protein D3C75_1000590 [compost metagenome]